MNLRLTSTKSKILVLVALGIIVSESFADNIIYCFAAPCNQPITTILGQIISNLLTFNHIFINTAFAVSVKNFFQAHISAGAVYLVLSLIISLPLWYTAFSLIQFSVKRKRKTV